MLLPAEAIRLEAARKELHDALHLITRLSRELEATQKRVGELEEENADLKSTVQMARERGF